MSLRTLTRERGQAVRKAAAELAREFGTAADELDEHVKNIRIARITGSTVSSAGAVTAIVGLGLALFTAGISLIPAAVGTAVSIAGAATSIGSEIAGAVLKKLKMKEMEEKWATFQELWLECFPQDYKPKALPGPDDGSKSAFIKQTTIMADIPVPTGSKITAQSGQAGSSAFNIIAGSTKCESAAAATARGLSVGASKVGIVLNVVGIGISVYDIVTASIDLYNEKKCSAGEILRMFAADLDNLAKMQF